MGFPWAAGNPWFLPQLSWKVTHDSDKLYKGDGVREEERVLCQEARPSSGYTGKASQREGCT